jgi:hypothetical protein
MPVGLNRKQHLIDPGAQLGFGGFGLFGSFPVLVAITLKGILYGLMASGFGPNNAGDLARLRGLEARLDAGAD